MNDAIKAIADTINAPCPEQCDHDAAAYGKACAKCTHTAERIYTAHVKPLEDALDASAGAVTKGIEMLAAAKKRERMLVETLEDMVEIAKMTIGWSSTPEGADGPLVKARAALARVKGEA